MWTRDEVLAASHAWRWVPPGAEELLIEDVVVIDYPSWARMGFYAMPEQVADPTEAIGAVCEAARNRGHAAAQWWVNPSTRPADLGATLVERGAVESEVTEILAYDLSQGLPDLPVPDDVHALVVADAQSLDATETVAAVVWGGEPSSGQRRKDQLRSLGTPLDAQGGFRTVAYLDEVPFATAGCQVVDGVARLYGGCVLPTLRGRGGYLATLGRRMAVASQNGAHLALVHARVATSGPILRRVGFQSYGEARLYTSPV